MNPVTRAVIDIGTNSVKLLVAEVGGVGVRPLLELSEQTRLGSGFYQTHRLQKEAVARTARAVAQFAERTREVAPVIPRVIATSAARDAENGSDLVEAVREAAGLEVQIISGDQEAEWVFRGVTAEPELGNSRVLILDVGGGSTEFILGQGEHHAFRQSFHLGSVRMLEQLRPSDPPTIQDLASCQAWLQELFNQQVTPAIESFLANAPDHHPALIGTGGTATILARMDGRMEGFDRERIEGTRLSRHQLGTWMMHLWSQPLADRQRVVGLPPNRADIIIMGVAIYEAVMEHFNFDELQISARGLRFGALM